MLVHPLHTSIPLPALFPSPFSSTPHPLAKMAAEEVMERVRAYMAAHPESELHQRGKMFGVLVVSPHNEHTASHDEHTAPHDRQTGPHHKQSSQSLHSLGYLAAFSAMLDGQMQHEGFVPPVYDWSVPDGYFRKEEAAISVLTKNLKVTDTMALRQERKHRSQALQRWLFAQFKMINAASEQRDLLDIFASEPVILSPEEYFAERKLENASTPLPPSGAGECCAPKLLQFAFLHGLRPVCMAEFWMGASPHDEVRIEGRYYPACQGKCRPILRHMLQGTAVAPNPLQTDGRALSGKITVIHEDNDLLVIDKPSGLLSVPGKEDSYSVQEYLEETYQQPVYAVHRLDMDTSGLLIFAKTPSVAEGLQVQFLRHEVKKKYVAVLESQKAFTANQKSGVISLPLLPNPFDRPRQLVDFQHGKPAITEWQILDEQYSVHGKQGVLVALFPQTGRTHQLRVHCAHADGLGCPIMGDRLYGNAGDRLMLHATELQFTHPVTHERLIFRSDPSWT